MGILLVYNVIDDKSFANIRTWMRNIEQHANEQVVKILLGNQCDYGPEKRVRIHPRSFALTPTSALIHAFSVVVDGDKGAGPESCQ